MTTFYSSPLFTQGFTSSATSTFNDPSFFNALTTFASLPSIPLTFGNVLVGSSTGKAEPLAPGTQNQIFTINASGTPEWMSGATLTGLSVVGTTTLQGPVNINTTGTSTTTIGNASSSIVLAAGTLTSATSSFATSTIGSLILGTTTATTTDEILMRDLTTGEVKSLAASNFLLAATTNSATTSSNTLTSTVNGIAYTAVNLINSFTQTPSGNTLTTTINGVTATSSVVSNNSLSYATSTGLLTSDINGVISTTTISANLAELSSGE